MNRIGDSIGLKLDFIDDIPAILNAVGFENTSMINHVVPVGTWPKNKALKRIGAVFRLQFLDSGLEAYSTALFSRNGWSEIELQVLLAHVRAELLSNKMHLYTYTYVSRIFFKEKKKNKRSRAKEQQIVCNCDEAIDRRDGGYLNSPEEGVLLVDTVSHRLANGREPAVKNKTAVRSYANLMGTL